MTSLFKIINGQLAPAQARMLSKESMIEDWVAADPRLLGIDAMVIGRQVLTDFGKLIDLLAIDRSGNLVIIELKRDKTARDIVGQVLDYASWVHALTTPKVYEVAKRRPGQSLDSAFLEKFGEPIPEQLNQSHSMWIVASELDPSSRRIVEYLSEVHDVAINTAFFNVFEADGHEWVTTNFLLDQAEVEERSERKVRAPWSGYYFVNAGIGEDRSWKDMVKYGFVGANGGSFYSNKLDQLQEGDKLFAYQKGAGYIGYGTVRSPKALASQFMVGDKSLFELPLDQPAITSCADDPENAHYVVGVDWSQTFDIAQAKWIRGAFANQNIVCKIRDQATVNYLTKEFSVGE